MPARERRRRLTRAEWRLLCEALVLVALVRVALWFFPFSAVERRYQVDRMVSRPGSEADPAAIALAVRRAARLIPAASCLTQALAARAALARRKLACDLRIGVAKDDRGRLQAHAWVECEGRVLLGDLPDLTRFVPMPRLPGDAA
jgi:hypothetical protein